MTVKLTNLEIKNFRAIKEADIDLNEINALVGQNGSGKSSILRALNAFFNFDEEAADFKLGNHAYGPNTQSVISITFHGFNTKDLPDALSEAGETTIRLKFRKRELWDYRSSSDWKPAPTNIREIIRSNITFALIPIRRDYTVANDPMTGLLAEATEQWILNHQQRDRHSPKIEEIAEKLLRNALGGFERQLREIAPLDGPYRYELSYSEKPDYRLLLQSIELRAIEGGRPLPLSDCGSGTQSIAVFALLATIARLRQRTFLLGFEEPEQNLHPQAQKQLMKVLSDSSLQVVFTTHSPTLVDQLDHESVILCKRSKTVQRGIVTEIRQIKRSFFNDAGIDREKYYKFHRRMNSEFLFASSIIVTESPIDAKVVEKLLTDTSANLDLSSTAFISLGGVESIEYVYHLLQALGIPASFIVDKDWFLPYLNDERSSSLNNRGYPKFKRALKNSGLLLILFPSQADREEISVHLHSNHAKAMDILQEKNFYCFRYSLEVDLVASKSTRENLARELDLDPDAENLEHILLIANKKRIKSQSSVLASIEGIQPRELPNSYKRLRSRLPEFISKYSETM